MQQIKYILIVFFVVLLSHQAVCHAEITNKTLRKLTLKSNSKFSFNVWPIFFGGGTFFFNELGPAEHWPGYTLSGGLTASLKESDIIIFSDLLYSYRAYDGYPDKLHYRIQETTADFAIGAGYQCIYGGAYIQFPIKAHVKVDEWTIDNFSGLSRNPSFSLMVGYRITGKYLGIDARILLGQGPGQFLKSSFGDHWLGQISLGIMGGF